MNDLDQKINVQPHSIDAELAVLGSMLSSKEAVSKTIQWLKPNHFYKDSNGKIFSAMLTLFENGDPIDTVSLIEVLRKNKDLDPVGGAYFITGLVESVPTVAHVERYSKIVLEKALLRRLILLSHDIAKEAYDDTKEVNDILDYVEKSIFNITQNQLRGGFQHINPIVVESLEKLEKINLKKGNVIGVPSGLIDLDDLTSGFQEGDLIIVAGRPGMGKTASGTFNVKKRSLRFEYRCWDV